MLCLVAIFAGEKLIEMSYRVATFAQKINTNDIDICLRTLNIFANGNPVRLLSYPVKRHRGEPGHTRDTHGTRGRTRAHGTQYRYVLIEIQCLLFV